MRFVPNLKTVYFHYSVKTSNCSKPKNNYFPLHCQNKRLFEPKNIFSIIVSKLATFAKSKNSFLVLEPIFTD